MIAPGEIATIVTYLDMRERPRPVPMPDSPLRLVRWPVPVDPARYRTLFTRIGGPWLWFSRLAMTDADLRAIIGDERVQIFAAQDRDGVEIGMIELDFREPGQCELAYFGLVPELAGKGHGRWLMAETLARAWTRETKRVHVHTCTLDHPAALRFYILSGFIPRGRAIERFPDPRLAGLLPRDAAPHVPILER